LFIRLPEGLLPTNPIKQKMPPLSLLVDLGSPVLGMVLPWVQEAGSAAWDPSFQTGCAFVDVKGSHKDGLRMYFAVDRRMSLQLKVLSQYPLTGDGFFCSGQNGPSTQKQVSKRIIHE
jgi:hypothetical protein